MDGVLITEEELQVESLQLPTVKLTVETKPQPVYLPGGQEMETRMVPTGRGRSIEVSEDEFIGVEKLSFEGDRGYITQNIIDRCLARIDRIVTPEILGSAEEFKNLPHFDESNELVVVVIVRKKPKK